MKISVVYILLSISFIGVAKSQGNKTYLQESKPLSPAAYEFLKYTSLPVSEYTGIPDVSIPVYEIKEDGVSIPVNLNYHASGITVNEEASAVGLGWTLQFGSIVQIINDQNDLNPQKIKQLPDYIGNPLPTELPLRHNWPVESSADPTRINVNPVKADYGFPIATGTWFPIKGVYDVDRYQLFNNIDYDTEPDIFKANFLGYSVNFIKDFENGGNIVVLNKVGYKVEYMADDSWSIIVPSGEQFFFALKNVASTSAISTSVGGPDSNPSMSPSASTSVMWNLTKIITKNKREIVFNYSNTASVDHFPGFSQTWKKASVTTSRYLYFLDVYRGFWNTLLGTTNAGNLTTTLFYPSEAYMIPSSIVFPLGRLDFYNSDRKDALGGKKIDSIALTADRLHKTFKLQYSYFNSSGVVGNGFSFEPTTYKDLDYLRLKLETFTDETGGVYQFNYDPITLPRRNSYAQDQWGYYNGALDNTSLIPNPTQYNKPDLGNNGNNHSASENYAKACSLKQIIYPTGGSVNFDFELNEFSNYWVPDYNASDNIVSHGNGLRIKKITWKQADNSISKAQQFEYSDGKALLPINLYRVYNHPTGTGAYSNSTAVAYFSVTNYLVSEFNANGYYNPSSLSAINGVGYSQVTSKYVDQNNNSTGAVTTSFNNTPAILPLNSVQSMTINNVSVPAREDWDKPKNGTVDNIRYFDKLGKLIKKSANTYTNYKSGIFYGARMSSYGNYIYYMLTMPAQGEWASQLQTMFAEYPIYDFESLVSRVRDVDYFEKGDSLVTKTVTEYNSNRLVSASTKSGINIEDRTSFEYTVLPAMVAQNRLSDIIQTNRSISTNTSSHVYNYESKMFKRSFVQVGDRFLPLEDVEKNGSRSVSNVTTYDSYDTNGNVSQLTEPTGTTSLIWSYDNKYLIAKVINALRTECAYTSFEQKQLEMSGDWIIYPSVSATSRDNMVLNSYMSDGHTGVLCSNASAIESKVLPSKNYIFSLYAKGTGTITVNNISKAISGDWKKYEWNLSGATKVNIQNNGNNLVDELTVYPLAAQITTYTYDPLVGITSETDEKGRVTYYEYDNFQRLKTIKDQRGNHLKKYDYHISGQ